MPVRRSEALAVVAVAVALVSGCKQVTQEAPPPEIVVAAFNSQQTPSSTSPALPTPNDLALQATPTLPVSAQRALLQAFVDAGGFPSDQAVGITVPLKRLTFDASASKYVLSATPPLIDTSTVTAVGGNPTVVVMKIDQTPPAIVTIEVDAENCTTGQIALRKGTAGPAGSRAWAPGRYVFAVRGGAGGVKTTTGLQVDADQAIALVIPNKNLANPDNQPPGGLPAALIPLVEAVRAALWQPMRWDPLPVSTTLTIWNATPDSSGALSAAFPAVATVIPPEQVAAIGTFEIAPALPTAAVDSGSGIAPLPLDLLRTANGGRTIAYNPAFGPAAEGLTTLDGFSTTAMIFAPTTVPVDASTVNGSTVHLFKISGGSVTLLKELKQELGIFQATGGAQGLPAAAAYVAQPDPINVVSGTELAPGLTCARTGGCSPIVGLQAAVAAPTPAGTFYLPPLDEASDYAVVITTAVKDLFGRNLRKSTMAKILLDPGFDPVASSSVAGISYLSGVSNETASALRRMREQLVPVMGALSTATGKTAADVALAYTFRTQGSIKSTALALVTVPYGAPVGVAPDADAVTTFAPATIAAQYGIDPSILTTLGTIAEFAEVKLQTVSWLLASQNKGAFDPAHPAVETVTALVTIPEPALVTGTCPAASPAYTAGKCAPLVIFEHGLTSSKAAVLPLAGALAARGFIVAAIDTPMHGERSYCSGSGPNAQALANGMCCPAALCGTQSTCAFKANLTTPVDLDAGGIVQIGVCESAPGVRGRMLDHRLDSDLIPSPKGTAFASANRLISLNFFRVRDALRQDVIDQSALVKALAPVGASTDAFASHLETTHGIAVDYSRIYWVGHSGGVFSGTASLAANPRITRAATYAGGATAIDVFANPESHYHANLVALLSSAGISEGTADYLKFLQIGKWILDPADPANFARHVVPAAGTPLPNPFAAPPLSLGFPALAAIGATQPAREVLTQISMCDGTVPNAQNTLLSALFGRKDDGTYVSGYAVPAPATSTTAHVQWFSQTGAALCPGDAVGHSNLLDFSSPSLAAQAQASIGSFLAIPANVVTPVLP